MTVEVAALLAVILFALWYRNYKIAAYLMLSALFGFLYICFAGYIGEFPGETQVTGLGSDALALLELSRFFFFVGIIVFLVSFVARINKGLKELSGGDPGRTKEDEDKKD